MAEHHPSDAVLLDFVSGALPFAAALPIAAHLEGCAICRSTQDLLEMIGGALLESSDVVPMEVDFADLINRLDQTSPETPERRIAVAQEFCGAQWPMAVRNFEIRRRRWIAPGLWAADVRAPSSGGWKVFALGLKAGGVIPPHGHRGPEFIHVFQGEVREGATIFREGDFLESDAGKDHELRVTDNGPCVCLISSQAPLIWRGWLKVLTPWIGI
jgi:putative transcriptional regulator